ncbi:Zn(2)-C6 fungal-type DNA-binding domain protein [Cordyceps fumosorosea ARSEF 2679]|uniref:Zn(2)-C6 fungal-type DNA-binding domain protein n=1 Tax=Cordyceps fumosorosea (strain ARSEF 2679) TaxID=1081104 RepID=A0A168CLX0_CORFA|nr:Zn(2)-C6 fungal-type DNA-binding domain protein [Cordyceps fumosorosea ARSEF 2679]OAA71538.1 Zn(2)-C6 fungal-type DNA-binding domain protein [Cordyceps fumosorosea ARSEF 2679]
MQDSSSSSTHQPSRPLQPKATTRGQERILESPTVKRRRVTVIACHHCRLKKIRCDGQKPACSSCATKLVPCTYRDAAREGGRSSSAVPGVLRMLGQLRAAELVRVVGRLKDEADAETILSTIRGSVEEQRRRDEESASPSTTVRGPRTPPDDPPPPPPPPPPLDDDVAAAMGAAGGLDVQWFWPACQPTTTATTTTTTTTMGMVDFAPLGGVPQVVDVYWWPKAWARQPNEF